MEGITLLDGEEFKQLNDYPDYFVSNCGRVYSTKTHRFIGSPNKKTGYFMVSLTKGRRSVSKYIHHLVVEYFGEPKPADDPERGPYELDHQDKHKDNNRIENLRWVVHQENLENRNEYAKERKKRLSKREVEIFNRWYIYSRESLMNLSNEKIAALFEDEKKIPIHSITVRNNRDRWYIDENDKLCRIPEEALDDVDKILRK